MKHAIQITLLLISMFLVSQLLGIYVAGVYKPTITPVLNSTTGLIENQTFYQIPYGLGPPANIEPGVSVISIVIALILAVLIMFALIKLKAETFLRLWFFVVITLGLALALNAFLINLAQSATIALIISLPLAYFKVFKRHIFIHNITELLIYPGIASIFIPLLNIWAVVILLIIISLYDMYAVWQAGFMQKMAKYQIETLRVFSGFFIPYIGKAARKTLMEAREKGQKQKRIPMQIAILGGGDVVFPIILAGVVLHTLGLIPALIVATGATISLAMLFFMSQKGKFYPAMPFISTGCLIALGIAYLIA